MNTALPADLVRIRGELLSAIQPTSEPARKRFRTRRIVAGGAVAFVVIALAGYTFATTWVGNRTFQDEYRAAQSQLRLPPGVTWPQHNIPKNVRVSTNEGAAVAVTLATTEWACYWSSAIHTGDTSAEVASARAFASLIRNNYRQAPAGSGEQFGHSPSDAPVAILAADGGYRLLKQEYRQGLSGNPDLLQQDCRANRPR